MRTLDELGEAVASKRKALGMKQSALAKYAGIAPETLSRFERGRSAEFGSRKLLIVLAVIGMELAFVDEISSGNLDELRKERGGRW